MAEQLVFALVDDEPPSFANFVAGPNAEPVALLEAAATRGAAESVVLWGGEGGGKSHLLRAFVDTAARRTVARYYAHPSEVVAGVTAEAPPGADVAGPRADRGGGDVSAQVLAVAIDRVDEADAAAQAQVFTLFNALRARGGTLVAASRVPPLRTGLRDDLRTRLGWGLVLEIRTLDDADKPRALAAYARARGFTLSDEAIAWLLAHTRRDMRSLTRALAGADRYSLAQGRAVSIALLREWMAGLPPA